jgi:hypothetical protein
MNDLQEATTFSKFKPGYNAYEDAYAQLCHVEGRLSYIEWTEDMIEGTREILEGLEKKVEDFRKRFFPDHSPYVFQKTWNQSGAYEDDEFTEDQENEPNEIEELDREIERVRSRIEFLKAKKAASEKSRVVKEKTEQNELVQVDDSVQKVRDSETREKTPDIGRERKQQAKQANERQKSGNNMFTEGMPWNKTRHKPKFKMYRRRANRMNAKARQLKGIKKRGKTVQATTRPKEKMKVKTLKSFNREASIRPRGKMKKNFKKRFRGSASNSLCRRASMWFRPPPDADQQ